MCRRLPISIRIPRNSCTHAFTSFGSCETLKMVQKTLQTEEWPCKIDPTSFLRDSRYQDGFGPKGLSRDVSQALSSCPRCVGISFYPRKAPKVRRIGRKCCGTCSANLYMPGTSYVKSAEFSLRQFYFILEKLRRNYFLPGVTLFRAPNPGSVRCDIVECHTRLDLARAFAMPDSIRLARPAISTGFQGRRNHN